MEKIYKVSFGKIIRSLGVAHFVDRVNLDTGNGEGASCPVYGKFEEDKLVALFTDVGADGSIEIPFPTSDRYPGFAAFYLEPVTSPQNMEELAYYSDWLSPAPNREIYKEALLKTIDTLNELKKDYIEAHGGKETYEDTIRREGNSLAQSQQIIDKAFAEMQEKRI